LRRGLLFKQQYQRASLADVMAWGRYECDKQKQTKQNKPFFLIYIYRERYYILFALFSGPTPPPTPHC
jgi:hypothetical protein